MKSIYLISEIANKFKITRPTLIHYDQIDLLKPSFRNEKNYRFYTEEDVMKLEIILAMKDSGLTLKAIKDYLNGKSNEQGYELLLKQQKEIDKKIAELKRQRKIIEKRVSMLKKFSAIELYEGILIDSYPEISILIETIDYSSIAPYDLAIERLNEKLPTESQINSKIGKCYDLSSYDDSKNYKIKYVFDYLNIAEKTEDIIHLPKSQYIKCIHQGPLTAVNETIQNMLEFALENSLNLGNDAFLVPLFDYWESVTNNPFISEILIPCTRQ